MTPAPRAGDERDVAELRDAWREYGLNARVMDGHTAECAFRSRGDCSCGFRRVEYAIRALTSELAAILFR